jgi:DNA replication ATP-dependent helicase Dna2
MAKDYLIVKGYPGTGKTSTIAALIAILTALGKKVLFTSFTNSAVDNLLIKIVNEVTIGSCLTRSIPIQKIPGYLLSTQ